VSRIARSLVAIALAVACGAIPAILDQCAASCELSQAASTPASAPACHHQTSTTARIGRSPTSCGHDHRGTVSTLTAGAAPIERTLIAAWGIPAASPVAFDTIALRIDARSTASPPASHSPARALSLRI